jgi:2-polyprenyl-3-methyl-5-hydroxy-6-metoxy-1,4-benzoquinol methylase
MSDDLTTPQFWDAAYLTRSPVRNRVRQWVRERQYRSIDRMWLRLIEVIERSDAEVLEVGCAPGAMLERIHRLRPGFRLHGIDYAEAGVTMTRRRLQSLGIEATITQGDIRDTPLPRRFDVAFSFGLLEHFQDPVPILRCHADAVVPGGWVAITMPNYGEPLVQRALIGLLDPGVFQTHNRKSMSPGALREAMLAAGLQNVRVGTAGGPILRTDGTTRSQVARVCGAAARAWNMAAVLCPGAERLWGCHIWGRGQVAPNAGRC